MRIYSLLLPVVVGIAIFQPGLSLVCYDNVANEGKAVVLLDCSYRGAVCAVTNMTTTTTTRRHRKRTTSSVSKLLYHCARKSCDKGPMNYCKDEAAGETIGCSTQCCDSDKCNTPSEGHTTIKTIAAKDALTCYQLIENRAETVECLFEEASCLSIEIGSQQYSFLSKEVQASQFCATKEKCDEFESVCNEYRSSSYSILDSTCTFKCCKTNYCNSLRVKYESDDSVSDNTGYRERDNSYGGYRPGNTRNWRTIPTKWIVFIVILVISVLTSACCGVAKASRKKKQATTTVYTRAVPATGNQFPDGTVEASLWQPKQGP